MNELKTQQEQATAPTSPKESAASALLLPKDAQLRGDFQKKHELDLSAGRYARNKLVEVGATLTAMFGGMFGGYTLSTRKPEWLMTVKAHSLSKTIGRMREDAQKDGQFDKLHEFLDAHGLAALKDSVQGKAPERKEVLDALMQTYDKKGLGRWSTGVGGVMGFIAAGSVVAYEHWMQQEVTKRNIQEINEDMSQIRLRMRTDPALIEENERLREMLKKEASKTALLQQELQRRGGVAASTPSTAAVASMQGLGRVADPLQVEVAPTVH